jgi:SAM-dependent methyltransferase
MIHKDFLPNKIYLFSNPFYITRRLLYRYITENTGNWMGGRLLDVGCGSKPYQSIFHVSEYVGLDYNKPGNEGNAVADLYYDGGNFPCKNAEFDYILLTEVLEHVFNPDDFLKEVFRVLKPGGQVLITVPFSWDEHEPPYDYGRYTVFGLDHLLKKSGFKINKMQKSGNFIEVIGQYISLYLFYRLMNKPMLLKIATPTILAFIQGITLFLAKVLPKDDRLYFDNICLAQKPDTRQNE